jgi:hypothetical protein
LIEVVGDASVPPPELLTVTFCEAGFEPPVVALKLRAVGYGDIVMVGELPDPMVSVTGRLTGVLLAPELAT